MIETALVFDNLGRVIHWHEPPGRSGGSLPDSQDLWGVLWHNRYRVAGVAHTHPWDGEAWASTTDLSTFAAIEDGLGKYKIWPVVTFTEIKYFARHPITREFVEVNPRYVVFDQSEEWKKNIQELRRRSQGGHHG